MVELFQVNSGLGIVICIKQRNISKGDMEKTWKVFPVDVVGTLLPWEQAKVNQMDNEKHISQLPTIAPADIQLTPRSTTNCQGNWQLTTDISLRAGEKIAQLSTSQIAGS